jgi:hypothetical protein
VSQSYLETRPPDFCRSVPKIRREIKAERMVVLLTDAHAWGTISRSSAALVCTVRTNTSNFVAGAVGENLKDERMLCVCGPMHACMRPLVNIWMCAALLCMDEKRKGSQTVQFHPLIHPTTPVCVIDTPSFH